MAKRFWFSWPMEGVAQNRINQIQYSERDLSIRADVVPNIFQKLGMENGERLI